MVKGKAVRKARTKKGKWNPFGSSSADKYPKKEYEHYAPSKPPKKGRDLTLSAIEKKRRKEEERLAKRRSNLESMARRQSTILEEKRKSELYTAQAERYEAKARHPFGRPEPVSRKLKRGLKVSRKEPRWF
jgi:hypothetical protein